MINEKIKLSRVFLKKGMLHKTITTLIDLCELNDSDNQHESEFRDIFNQLMLLSSRLHIQKKYRNQGVVGEEFINREFNNISKALIEIMTQIEGLTPEDIKGNQNIPTEKGTGGIGVLVETKADTCEIELTIRGNIDSYSEQEREDLLRAISVLLSLDKGEIVIKRIRPGSIKLTIELKASKAEELLKRISNGDFHSYNVIDAKVLHERKPRKGEIERIYDEYYYMLYAYAFRLTRNESESKDLVQDVFLKLLSLDERKLNVAMKPRGYLRYLQIVLKHTFMDRLRRKKQKEVATEFTESITNNMSIQDFEKEMLLKLELDEILVLLKTIIPADLFMIFELYINGHSYKELSQIFDKSTKEIGLLIHRIRKNLIKKLRQQ